MKILVVDDSAYARKQISHVLTKAVGEILEADGGEQLSGWLRAGFAAGQRTANVHVAFCPPFPKTPQLTVEQLDGPEVRIRTAQLLPHGLRLDLKLAVTAEKPLDVLLQFSARSNSPAAPATARRQPL